MCKSLNTIYFILSLREHFNLYVYELLGPVDKYEIILINKLDIWQDSISGKFTWKFIIKIRAFEIGARLAKPRTKLRSSNLARSFNFNKYFV